MPKENSRSVLSMTWRRLLLFLSVFGPATITAMADNDAGGVATYSIAGAKLGYPILFPLLFITILLGVTQEMGMRLTIVTRHGLADLIREKYGVKVAHVHVCQPADRQHGHAGHRAFGGQDHQRHAQPAGHPLRDR